MEATWRVWVDRYGISHHVLVVTEFYAGGEFSRIECDCSIFVKGELALGCPEWTSPLRQDEYGSAVCSALYKLLAWVPIAISNDELICWRETRQRVLRLRSPEDALVALVKLARANARARRSRAAREGWQKRRQSRCMP